METDRGFSLFLELLLSLHLRLKVNLSVFQCCRPKFTEVFFLSISSVYGFVILFYLQTNYFLMPLETIGVGHANILLRYIDRVCLKWSLYDSCVTILDV